MVEALRQSQVQLQLKTAELQDANDQVTSLQQSLTDEQNLRTQDQTQCSADKSELQNTVNNQKVRSRAQRWSSDALGVWDGADGDR